MAVNTLALNDLAANAFRILGLTAAASQAEIEAAARKMRIWQDPAMIPASDNDAPWIGPVPRSPQQIENAVARLADPVSRMEERFWWFSLTPPPSDAPPSDDRSTISAYHDAALVHLYRSLLGDISGDNLRAWQAVIERFRKLAKSDDYLQWLMEIESTGDFEKAATLDEIAEAQGQIPNRLSTALSGSVHEALQSGDFASASKAVKIAGADASATTASDALVDRMEEDLAARCRQLTDKINEAWETRKINELRPACNHAVSRYETTILPLIGQLVSSTRDVDRHNRARMLGVELLILVSRAYEAFENFLAAERTLETAFQLVVQTPLVPMVRRLQDKIAPAADRQRKGVARGHRSKSAGAPEFKVKQGGRSYDPSWLSALSMRWLWWAIILGCGVARASCMFDNSSSTPSSGPRGPNPLNAPLGN